VCRRRTKKLPPGATPGEAAELAVAEAVGGELLGAGSPRPSDVGSVAAEVGPWQQRRLLRGLEAGYSFMCPWELQACLGKQRLGAKSAEEPVLHRVSCA
jgi:hypothetical protein